MSCAKRKGLTQEGLAAKLYVTRQAVSRWERGEVVPGIDMMKLIANVLDEPIMHLLDLPERYCESCGMILTPADYGSDADGSKDEHYCKWCYEQGKYTYETTMDAYRSRIARLAWPKTRACLATKRCRLWARCCRI